MPAPRANAFAQWPLDARTHFTLHVYGAVLFLLRHLEAVGGAPGSAWHDQFPFLDRYRDEIRSWLRTDSLDVPETLHRWRVELAAWSSSLPEHLPLRALQTRPPFTAEHLLALVLAGLPEEDSRFGTIFARLQEPLASRTPTIELAGQMMSDPGTAGNPDGWRLFEQLLAAGLLRAPNPDTPRAERTLRVSPAVWRVLRGETLEDSGAGLQHYPVGALGSMEDLVLAPELHGPVRRLPRLLASRAVETVILRGMDGSGRLEVLGAVAHALGRGVLLADLPEDQTRVDPLEELGPLALLTGSIPALRHECGPGQTLEPRPLNGYAGPVGILLGGEGGLRGRFAERSVTLTLPPTRIPERLQHWRREFNGHASADLPAIAERFHLPPGIIRRAARAALAQARLAGGGPVALEHVRQACREIGHERLNTLAERLETAGDWSDLVASPATHARLAELEDRCRHRERLLGHLGDAFRSSTCGVRTLFTGSSGTGKTLAACLLAASLEKDLYRLDLAAIVNKYIGETEKNLHRVLSRAEELDVLLLLDEGDALLGARTEVRSANDRYANLETNYLLQRLEHYHGIVIVTTNVGELIDPAFRRRMDVVVEFVRPRQDERRRIWELHLPGDHRVDEALLDEVALRCPFTGGQIRNAVAAASSLALRDASDPLLPRHLIEAIRGECRKAGLVAPQLLGETRVARGGMAGFRNRQAHP